MIKKFFIISFHTCIGVFSMDYITYIYMIFAMPYVKCSYSYTENGMELFQTLEYCSDPFRYFFLFHNDKRKKKECKFEIFFNEHEQRS